MLCQHAAWTSGPLNYRVCLYCTYMDLQLSRVLPSTLNDTLSVRNSNKKNNLLRCGRPYHEQVCRHCYIILSTQRRGKRCALGNASVTGNPLKPTAPLIIL